MEAGKQSDNSMKKESGYSDWIDITVPLHNHMVHWPGDTSVEISRVTDVEYGDSHTLSNIVMGSHSGTHMDAPLHYIRGGKSIDEMPLDTVVGEARVIEIQDTKSIKPAELIRHNINPGDRILFKTQNSSRVWETDEFIEDFIYITKEAADYLVEREVRLVGVDYLSVGGYKKDGAEVHKTLLGNGIWIIEGLDLSLVQQGTYDLVCLPLNITGGDGAPARVIVRHTSINP